MCNEVTQSQRRPEQGPATSPKLPTLRIVMVNYRDYARKYLSRCMQSLRAQNFAGAIRIDIVDNEASIETEDLIRSLAPEARYIGIADNVGFAEACNIGLRGAIEDGDNYVMLLNMDAFLAPAALSRLVQYLNENGNVACCQPLLLQWPNGDRIDSAGNFIHLLGFGLCGQHGALAKVSQSVPCAVGYCSGAAVVIRVSALERVGLLDDEMWMYCEDQDLGIRFRLSGWENMVVPDAIAYHEHEFARTDAKLALIDANRWLFMLRNYKVLTIIALLPLLLTVDLGLLVGSLFLSQLNFKRRSISRLLSSPTLKALVRNRKSIQQLRQIRDRALLPYLTHRIDYGGLNRLLIAPIEMVCWFYRSLLWLAMWW